MKVNDYSIDKEIQNLTNIMSACNRYLIIAQKESENTGLVRTMRDDIVKMLAEQLI